MTLLLIFLIVCVVYLVCATVIARGIHNRYTTRPDLPEVSIVVPARNEEERIGELLDSLSKVDYPADKLQIVIVNDQSTDRTREVALSMADQFKCRYEVHDCVDEPDGRLVAKTRPLAQGLDRATGEVILMTDADCTVPREWVRTMASYFTSDVSMVCGQTLPHPTLHAKAPLTAFETLDWLFLLGASAGMSGTGEPTALIGNNFSVRRTTYQEIGTFRALSFTDIDDLVLMRAVEKLDNGKIIFPADAGVLIYTRPLQSIKEVAAQRYRWSRGLEHMDWQGRFVIGFGIATHVTWPLWPLLIGPAAILPIALLTAGDAMVILRMLRHYRRMTLAGLVPLYPAFVFLYAIRFAGHLIVRKRILWKDRDF